MTDRLIIFDTTLRDGEQSPGASMTKEEKLRIAKQLERLRVDVIEAGFAASSNGDFEAVRSHRGRGEGLDRAARWRAPTTATSRGPPRPSSRRQSKRIHTFIATSPLHMEKKLRMTPDQVFEQAKLAVRFARQFTDNVEFSPEDGYRIGAGLPLPRAGGRDRRRRDHHQHPGHRGLRRARALRRIPRGTCDRAFRTPTRRSGASTATTIWAWRWPTRWPA